MADYQPTQLRAPRAICPGCESPPERVKTTLEPSGIWTYVFLCPNNHQWLTKWLPGELVA